MGGYLTDQWAKRNISARLLLPGVASVSAAVLAASAFFFHGTAQFVILLGFGLVAIMFLPGTMAVTQDVVHPGLRSTSRSVNIFIQSLLGTALGPLIIGAISDAYGLDKAMWFISPFILVAGILFFWGSAFYKKDLDECEKCQITFENA